MERTPVASSNLRAVGYDPETKILEVEFQSGSLYQYAEVPEEVYRALMNASSHGQYYNQNIKNIYLSTRIR